jgi:lipopolysaccharide export LptBFGC system permease protein LptF
VDMVSGTVHATPSFVTLLLVIALATSRVAARSASGWVQPATGWTLAAVAAGGLHYSPVLTSSKDPPPVPPPGIAMTAAAG